MCTVSFVATKNGFVITSNRDEQVLRAAIVPSKYQINNQNLFFPKDPTAGGTWYAVNENGNVLVLLNGAAEKHQHKPPYIKSRGLLVLDIISNKNPILSWENVDLTGIEPFTLVLFQNQKLHQLQWNETSKSALELDVSKPHIWSSSTLYDAENRKIRAQWFFESLLMTNDVNANDLMHFHTNTHTENTKNGLIINRNNQLKTLSITQSVITKNTINMIYNDLLTKKNTALSIDIQ